MAKALSQVYTAIRGSVGGVTYTANSYHSIVARSRVAPTNPRTGVQQAWRAAFAGAVGDWRIAASADRQAWDEYAASQTHSGPTGSYNVPGRQLYIGARAFLRRAEQMGQTVVMADDAPAPGSGPYTDYWTFIAATDTTLTLTFHNTGSEDLLIYGQRSDGYSVSRDRFGGPYRGGIFVEVAAGTDKDIEFTGLQPLTRYWVRVSGVTLTNRLVLGRSVRKDTAAPTP